MHARKNSLLDLSAKDMAVELMYITCMHEETHVHLELTAKDNVHIWKACAYQLP